MPSQWDWGGGRARVMPIGRRPDPAAFKRTCTHLIQASALPTLERLGVLERLHAAGAGPVVASLG